MFSLELILSLFILLASLERQDTPMGLNRVKDWAVCIGPEKEIWSFCAAFQKRSGREGVSFVPIRNFPGLPFLVPGTGRLTLAIFF